MKRASVVPFWAWQSEEELKNRNAVKAAVQLADELRLSRTGDVEIAPTAYRVSSVNNLAPSVGAVGVENAKAALFERPSSERNEASLPRNDLG